MWQSCLILCFLIQRVLQVVKNYHRKLHQLPYLDMSRIIYILCKKHNWVEEDSYPIVDASTLKKDIECGDIIEECRKIIHPPDIFTKPRGKYSSLKQKEIQNQNLSNMYSHPLKWNLSRLDQMTKKEEYLLFFIQMRRSKLQQKFNKFRNFQTLS